MPTRQAVVLRRLRHLLNKRENWTQGWFAIDKNGVPIQPCDPNAVRWCLLGGWNKVSDVGGAHDQTEDSDSEFSHLVTASQKLSKQKRPIAAFNDEHGHKKVLQAIDLAIKLYEEETT